MKTCSKCGVEKELDSFHKKKSNRDGLRSCCKICHKEANKAYDLKNADKVRSRTKKYREVNRDAIAERKRAWYQKNKERVKESSAAWAKANKEKRKKACADWYVRNASLISERKKIRRQDPTIKAKEFEQVKRWREANKEKHAAHLAIQGALAQGKMVRPDCCSQCGKACVPDGHHDDYSKPLVVRWLCRKCHVNHHQNESVIDL
jgi:hypothetical protein